MVITRGIINEAKCEKNEYSSTLVIIDVNPALPNIHFTIDFRLGVVSSLRRQLYVFMD